MKTNTKTSDAELLARIEADADTPTGPAIDGNVLQDIAAAVKTRNEAEDAVVHAVIEARHRGLSWGTIGAVLGVSRQGALQRYGRFDKR